MTPRWPALSWPIPYPHQGVPSLPDVQHHQLAEWLQFGWAESDGSLRQLTVTICPGPVVDEGLGRRVSLNVLSHRFALGPDAGPQGYKCRH